ncbi:MAG: dipeptidase PepE [Flavobacteriaceae bacterium]|nr:dipeptidase PepE [Flavobacteriaceae bacterium]|tara:strand:- start:2228 stop:2932 length:705 start_codon:yes stop_codon:yes gene_type:complete
MKKMLLASTSIIYGQKYLEYLLEDIKMLFSGCKKIIFIPYARPSGITHLEYTEKVKKIFESLNLKILNYTKDNIKEQLEICDGIFTGGGNTFLLLNKLYEFNLIEDLRDKINSGIPYLGTSAGTNICGLSIGTTNDMPIINVESFEALGIIDLNINPHYIDQIDGIEHMGESRETRINEFHNLNNQLVVGLREGSILNIVGDDIILKGAKKAVIFKKGNELFEIKTGFNLKNLI